MNAPTRSSPSAPCVMAALKAATAEAHAAVERHVDLERMSSSTASYRQLLAKFHGFYEPLERRLRAADWSGLSLQPIWRTQRLERDLKALNVADVAALAACEPLPTIENVSQLAGTLYVIEGAALGGQIIARTIRERLSIGPTNGGAFFAGDAEQTGRRWKEFRAAVESAPIDVEHSVAAALQTFDAFESWLSREDGRDGLSKDSQ